MLRNLLNKIRTKYSNWLDSALVLDVDASSTSTISKNGTKLAGIIVVRKGGKLTIEDGVHFSGKLLVEENSIVHIGKNCSFIHVEIQVINGSKMELGENCIFDASERHLNYVNVEDHSKMILKNNVRIQGDVLVRFGGEFNMGIYSSINWGSEIRCDEKVSIGDFCLMSYEVCIYDTNTHTTDWQERRKIIPNRAQDTKRPPTKPVVIGSDVWIGKGVTILKGTTIGDKSVIGIRTVVPSGNYPEGSIIVSPKPVVMNA